MAGHQYSAAPALSPLWGEGRLRQSRRLGEGPSWRERGIGDPSPSPSPQGGGGPRPFIYLRAPLPLQQPPYRRDDLLARDPELTRPLLAPNLVVGDGGGLCLAHGEILDLHLARHKLVGAGDDDAGRIAAIGIF